VDRTTRKCVNIPDRVSTPGWTKREITLKELTGNIRFSDRRAGWSFKFHRPAILRRFNFLQILQAGSGARSLSSLDPLRCRHRQQNADDQDNNHDLDKGKPSGAPADGLSTHVKVIG
jgi:hypothetical protein